MSQIDFERLLELTLFDGIVSRPAMGEICYRVCVVCREGFHDSDQVILHLSNSDPKQSPTHAGCFITYMAINDTRACPGCYEIIKVPDEANITDAVDLATAYHTRQHDIQKEVHDNWTKVKSTFQKLMIDVTKQDSALEPAHLDDLDESLGFVLKERFQWKARQLIDADILEAEIIWSMQYTKSDFQNCLKAVQTGRWRINEALARMRLGLDSIDHHSSRTYDALGRRLESIIRAALNYTLECAVHEDLPFHVVRKFKTWAANIDGYGLLLDTLNNNARKLVTMDDFLIRIGRY